MIHKETSKLKLKVQSYFIVSFLSLLFSCAFFQNEDDFNEGMMIPGTKVFLPLEFHSENVQAKVSPDGVNIVFANYYNDSIPYGIYILNFVTGKKQMLVQGFGLGNANWSPDSKWIVYSGGGEIYKIRVNGDSLTQLTFNGSNFSPSWSPDGEWILFTRSVSDASGQGGSWIMRTDGTGKQYVFNMVSSSWSPDSKTIIGVRGISPTGHWDKFYIFDLQSSKMQDSIIVVKNEDNMEPQYSPDGERILFSTYNQGIWMISSDGSGLKRIVPQTSKLRAELPSWHPDNKRIVYSHFEITKFLDNQIGPYTEGNLSLYILEAR